MTTTIITAIATSFIFGMLVIGLFRRNRTNRFESQIREEMKALAMMLGKESEELRNHKQQQDSRLHDVEEALNMYHPHELEQMDAQLSRNGYHSDETEFNDPEDWTDLTSAQQANLK